MITKQNIEEYILMYVDQELSTDESDALLLFLQQHPEYQAMLTAYQATVLELEEAIIYPDKDILYKTEAPKVVVLPIANSKAKWWKMTAVAAVLALMSFGIYQFTWQNINFIDASNPKIAENVADQPAEKRIAGNLAENESVPKLNAVVPQHSITEIESAMPKKSSVVKTITPEFVAMQEIEEAYYIAPTAIQIRPVMEQKIISEISKPEIAVAVPNATNFIGNTIATNPIVEDISTGIKSKIEELADVSSAFKNVSIALSFGNKTFVLKK